jgi:hypothetical protein
MLRFGHNACGLKQNASVFVDPHQEPRIRLTGDDSTASRVSFDDRRFHTCNNTAHFPTVGRSASGCSFLPATSPLM